MQARAFIRRAGLSLRNPAGILLLVALCVIASPAFADTTWVAGGIVSGNWTSDGSPYMIQDAIHVPPGAVLFIGPGVTVFFTTRCYLVVDSGARIEATGAPEDSVYFTTDSLLVPDGWEGIPLSNATDTCRFEYCVFEYAQEPGFGGVFWSVHCPLILNACTFRRNSASSGWGGVASLEQTWVHISNCVFEDNSSQQGGVFQIWEARGVIENCLFQNNHAWSGIGGVMECFQHDSLTVRNCIFRANSAQDGGAVSLLSDSDFVFENCWFEQNAAGGNGGAIYGRGNCGAKFLNCVFDNNQAGISGGALHMSQSMIVDQCVFTHNTATSGGGIFVSNYVWPEMRVQRSTIVANTAADGAGIYLAQDARIQACIVAFNGDGVGIRVPPQDSPIPLVITNNLVFMNGGGEFSNSIHPFGINSTVNANGDSCDVYFNLVLDPQFYDSVEAYWLLATSPCIDAGPDSSAQFPFRDPDGTLADIGAFYYDQTTSAHDPRIIHPASFNLSAYPNPLNAVAAIQFSLPHAADVEVTVFDLTGRHVMTLTNGTMEAGEHSLTFNAEALPSGLYFARLYAAGVTQTRRLVLLK